MDVTIFSSGWFLPEMGPNRKRSILRAFYRAFDWIFFTKEANSDEEPDSVLMIDTPVCHQFLLVCTLERREVGHVAVVIL
jgi:hypothetical protein